MYRYSIVVMIMYERWITHLQEQSVYRASLWQYNSQVYLVFINKVSEHWCIFICTSHEGISAALSLQPVLEIHVVCPTAACGALFLQATDRLPSRALSLKVPPLTRVLQRICLGTPGRNRSATHSLIRSVHLPSAVRPRLMTSEYLPEARSLNSTSSHSFICNSLVIFLPLR